jgi:hypothetical protein
VDKPDTDFEQFWSIYPRHTAKAHARVMWNRLSTEEKSLALEKIPLHVVYWRNTGREMEATPHAGTWLNPVLGRRWEDELPEVVQKGSEWWRTSKGIEERAKAMGIHPKMGETHADLARRIRENA